MTIVRRMKRPEMDIALEWARQEGWNPGLGDADAFYAADLDGFFVAEIEGEIVGAISAVAYDDRFGFIGLFIVAPAHRCGPAGFQLLRTARRYMGNRNVGLDGVLERQEDYAKLGYSFVCENARYSGTFPVESAAPGEELVPLDSRMFAQVAKYDLRHFPAAREAFLRLWINPAGGRGLGIMKDGHLAGYGVIRPCHVGYKIGPLYAHSPEGADQLLRALGAYAGGAPVFLDVPGLNPEAEKLAERHNMQIVFKTARMYRQGKPDLDDQNIYGVTTFELG